jgi:hypothetical protein
MKKTSCAARVLAMAALLLFSRCNREKDVTPATPACKPVKQTIHTVGGPDPDTQILIAYNAQEKPSRYTVQTEGLAGQYSLPEYDTNGRLLKLTAYHTDGKVDSYVTYEYNQASQLVKITTHQADGKISITGLHEYDSNGNRVKTTFTSNQWGTTPVTSTTTYEYAGGNLVKSTDNSGGPWLDVTTEYEYYLDRENKLSTYEETILGERPNRNLLKKRTHTYPALDNADYRSTSEYTYEYNDKGFPTKVTSVFRNNQTSDVYTTETSYEYQCR